MPSNSSVLLSTTGHVRSSSTSLTTETTASTMNNDDELAKVQIYQDLCQYEDVLGQLINGVDNFKPDVTVAKKLIAVDKNLFRSLNFFAEYDKIDSELRRLDMESDELEKRTREILETLNDCYNRLNALPMLEQVTLENKTIMKQRSKINSSVLLDYATKLSKFTKIPPTFDKGAIGPNNFIWPAEDALRRGMLATASLHVKELTRIPGEPGDSKEEEEPCIANEIVGEEIDQNQSQIQEQKQPQIERRQSYVFTGDGDSPQDKSDDAIDLDLDLFNADEF